MEEKSLAKMTIKFIIKLILWFVVIDLILGFAVLMMFATKTEEIGNDYIELSREIKGLVTKLIIVNIAAGIIPALLATRGVKKKCVINDENKKGFFISVAVVLIIMSVLMGAIHGAIKNYIADTSLEDSNMTMEELKEARKDIQEYLDDKSISKEDREMVEFLDDFLNLANIYVFDCLVFIVMIPVEYMLISKKKELANA